MPSSQKRLSSPVSSPREAKKPAVTKKVVAFAQGDPKVCFFDPYNGYGAPDDDNGKRNTGEENREGEHISQLTEELTLLSTLHGQARRELRDISKLDLKTVMKYGTKTKGWTVNGDQRWKFEFGNTI